MRRTIEEPVLLCQGRTGYIVLRARGLRWTEAGQDDTVRKERKAEEA